jgi:hypothetical protein
MELFVLIRVNSWLIQGKETPARLTFKNWMEKLATEKCCFLATESTEDTEEFRIISVNQC